MVTNCTDSSKTNENCDLTSFKFVLPQEIKHILEFLSKDPKIVFKSQQRNDPELLAADKIKIAQEIYERNPQTFLLRFGNYLQQKHLEDFARLSIADSDKEMHEMIEQYLTNLKNRRLDVKNRRYTVLQKLIKEGEYFSEHEMMKRAPELYQELVGQYLSSAEKKQRDSYDVRNTNISGILLHTMEQQNISAIMAKAEQQIQMENKKQSSSKNFIKIIENKKENIIASDLVETEEPIGYCKQWGNFDNEDIACSSSYMYQNNSKNSKIHPFRLNNLISADERNLLKQEFIDIMYEKFLDGQDQNFDYASVDDNAEFDDLQQIDRDKEDEYFNESDEEEYMSINEKNVTLLNGENPIESEDELDIYMNHLQNHHSFG